MNDIATTKHPRDADVKEDVSPSFTARRQQTISSTETPKYTDKIPEISDRPYVEQSRRPCLESAERSTSSNPQESAMSAVEDLFVSGVAALMRETRSSATQVSAHRSQSSARGGRGVVSDMQHSSDARRGLFGHSESPPCGNLRAADGHEGTHARRRKKRERRKR